MNTKLIALAFCAVAALVAGPAFGLQAITGSNNGDALTIGSGGEIEFQSGATLDVQAGTTIVIGKTDTVPINPAEGWIYWDDSENMLKVYTGSGWTALAGGTFTGGSITGDVTLDNGIDILSSTTTAHTNSIQARDIDGGAYVDILRWINGDTAAMVLGAATVQFSLASTGLDISTAGAISNATTISASGGISGTTGTFTSGIILDSGATVANATDSEIALTDAAEDLIFDMDASTNVVGLKSSTGVTGLAMGDVDDLSGVGTIAFDAAASTVTLASGGAAQDLTVRVTGATDSSLVLSSTGTGADALKVSTSAGGLDITVAGAAAGEDLDLLANSSVNITSTEAGVDDAIVISASGAGSGMQITSLADIDISTTGAAGEDIQLINIGGSINIIATEDDTAAITINTTGGGGTSEGIDIVNDQGTADDAINIQATAGGIDMDAGGKVAIDSADDMTLTITSGVGGEDFSIIQSGANDSSILLTAAGTGADAIGLSATAGTIKIAGDILDMDSTGDFNITVTASGDGEDLLISQVGANDSSVTIAAAGTGTDAIGLQASAGGVDIDAAAAQDVAIGGGQVAIASKDDAASAISLTANVGTSETIVVTNTQGTAAGAITLTATAGGITMAAASGVTGGGTTAHNGFLKTVTDDTDGAVLTAALSGTVQTNAGAGGPAAWTLPAAAAGIEFTFVVMAAQELRVTPAAGDVINIAGTAGEAAEYWTANAIGETLHLIAVDGTNWIAISSTGTWTQQTP